MGFKNDPIPTDYLDATFGESGYLSQRFSGYAPRAGQVALAQAIDAAMRGIDGKKHVIAEGPTGTGKSLAYSVTATYHAAEQRKTVVIATANIALQEQLVSKDLPLLQSILPWPFTFGLLKGIGNYLCLSEREKNVELRGVRGTQFAFAQDAFDAINAWAEQTLTGDKNELPFEPGKEWAHFSTSSDDCKRDRCRFADDCFARRAMSEAREKDVIVCNYHLLFADVMVRLATQGEAYVIPPYEIAILDEAHKAADIARNFFGWRLTPNVIRRAVRKLAPTRDSHGLPDAVARELEGACNDWFCGLTDYMESKYYQTRLRVMEPVDASEFIAALEEALDHEDDLLTGVGKDREAEVMNSIKKLRLARKAVEDAMMLARDPEVVYVLEKGSGSYAALKSMEVNVAPILKAQLFDACDSVTVTSATLSTGGRFDWIMEEIGAPKEETITLEAPSPFVKEQALIVVPDRKVMPMPQEKEDYSYEVRRVVRRIVEMTKGGVLCLFTSYKNLNAAASELAAARLPYKVLVQGCKPRSQLVEEFKADRDSVLLGTESFWAGVDVPGPALRCVIIDRLPFPTPDDPVLDAISGHDDRWFWKHSVPRAMIQLKQGVGRLIRSVGDRGVVVVLDRRLREKTYGRDFLRSLPPMFHSRDMNDIVDFLDDDPLSI